MSIANRADDGTYRAVGQPPAATPEAAATGHDPAAGPGADSGSRGKSWRSPAVLVIALATAVGLALRMVLLTRPGFLTSGTPEYDDGVYLGAAIRLLDGALPYKDYAFVQPPGILVIGLPFAVIAKVSSAAAALAAARVGTLLASTACVALAGRLVRHKGAGVTLVVCGLLAIYPADVLTARTLLLEPWMNLLCLLAANVAFAGGRLASPRRLAWAGVVLGFATTVKFWAAVPAVVLLAVCLLTRENRVRRARAYVIALAAGFVVPIAPFAAAAPLTLVRSAVFDQVTRLAEYTPLPARLAYLTGTIDFIDGSNQVRLDPGAGSALARGSNAVMVLHGTGWLPPVAAVIILVVLAAGYLRRRASTSPLEWFALAVFVMATTAITSYTAFYYHYPSFPAPWLAIAFATAAAGLLARKPAAGAAKDGPAAGAANGAGGARKKQRAAWRAGIGVTSAAMLAIAALEGSQLATQTAPLSPAAVRSVVPKGACLITDQVSFAIAADRFSPAGKCPDVLDSLATTLVLSGGVSFQGGASKLPRLRRNWEAILTQAQYVWLSPSHSRLAWSPELAHWFDAHFRLVRTFPDYNSSELYERR